MAIPKDFVFEEDIKNANLKIDESKEEDRLLEKIQKKRVHIIQVTLLYLN
jgi:hypothetical protein